MHKWQQFERLAEQIYKELSPLADVKWDDHIYGHDSEDDRQIDVSIRWNDGDVDRLLIVQARDRSTRADINDVGEFVSVVQDVRASGGFLVCRSGFTQRAKKMARNRGVGLHGLHDAMSLDWSQKLSVPILWIDLLPYIDVSARVWLDKGDQVEWDDEMMKLFTDEGHTRVLPVATFKRLWNNGSLDRSLGRTHELREERPLFALVTDRRGRRLYRQVEGFRLEYVVSRRAWLGNFIPAECRGLIDHLAGEAFVVSHLPIGELPTQRDAAWQEISDPEAVAVQLRGTFVTSESYEVSQPGAPNVSVRYLGPKL